MEFIDILINAFHYFVEVMLHLDKHLNEWIAYFGPGIYFLLFLIVFLETGVVVTPFLPGDSLLFALGALTTVENAQLSLPVLMVTLIVAGILGDAVNYHIGKYVGPRIFTKDSGLFLNKAHLVKTQHFYEKYGGKTIIFARFIPIIRTFAPFVAGVGHMNYRRFAMFNVTGAVLWVVSFLLLGHYFGQHPYVQKNFHVVIVGIIVVSFLPAVFEFGRSRWNTRRLQKSVNK